MRLSLLLLFAVLAQSQPPPPTPLKSSQPKEQGAGPKKKKADNDQTITTVSAPVVDSPKTKNTAEDKQGETPTDWWTRIPTLVIAFAAVVQAYIYWRQKGLMAEALTETGKAANATVEAAGTQRTAMEISNRANMAIRRLRLVPPPGTRASYQNSEILLQSKVQIEIENVGHTNAKGFHLHLGLEIQGALQISSNPGPIVTRPTELPPGGGIIQSTGEVQSYFAGLDLQRSVSAGELEANGFIRYTDVFGHASYIEFQSTNDPVSWDFRMTITEKPDGQA